MSSSKGRHLKIRAMAYVAGEPVPFFWPMRSFIHHNPLHGLEQLPFKQAVEKGAKLFHARGFLQRHIYQGYLANNQVDRDALDAEIKAFVSQRAEIPGIDLVTWLTQLMESMTSPVVQGDALDKPASMAAVIRGDDQATALLEDTSCIASKLEAALLGNRPVYEAVDALCDTGITRELNDQVVRVCLDFFDEGQSVWIMPGREKGLFEAWRKVAGRKVQALLNRIEAAECTEDQPLQPEMVVEHVLNALQVPEDEWIGYLTREIAHLHGWAGFIRWRATANHYHWAERYPGDLVDLLGVRLALAWVLLEQRARSPLPKSVPDLQRLIDERPQEVFLRQQLHSGAILPSRVNQVEEALARRDRPLIARLFADYVRAQRQQQARDQQQSLKRLADVTGARAALDQLNADELAQLLGALGDFEKDEGMVWLRAMEAHSTRVLLDGLSLAPPAPREKRPFVQAAFCIDTRSERIRRHMEAVGDYQTFGIAGFFGVPVSLMELGKGSEMHLCPVLLTPKNLVLEMTAEQRPNAAAMTVLHTALHKLKETILTPFVTVEAIGLLFGFDMIGKTVTPKAYNRWRKHLHEHKPDTHLLLDKLSREQVDSIVRAVQRAIIEEAAVQELGLQREDVTDAVIRELREAALGNAELDSDTSAEIGFDDQEANRFIFRLRNTYRINTPFANRQMEELSRIGFTLDEQVNFVLQALSSIGLTETFSRFILLVGHGSASENNPYESALDCGACGGNHGLVSARVLAHMGNKPAVRKRLASKNIHIPDDTSFVPAHHNTTTDEITLHDLGSLPSSHLVYLDRLRNGLNSASRLCAQERLPSLQIIPEKLDAAAAHQVAQRNSMDWSQVRPEWGLARNAYFIIGRRELTQSMGLDGRAFLHSYDYRIDSKRRLLENILTGPLVVGQWINMEHYFSAVDNERFGSGSKIYHNVAGRFGVMTGNLGDLRTGLPSQTVLKNGLPYHEPTRLITAIEAPFEHARAAIESVISVKRLVRNSWIRLIVVDPERGSIASYDNGDWQQQPYSTDNQH